MTKGLAVLHEKFLCSGNTRFDSRAYRGFIAVPNSDHVGDYVLTVLAHRFEMLVHVAANGF
jgi:hypothetical protein